MTGQSNWLIGHDECKSESNSNPGFGTRYKFLDLDIFNFNILVGGGASCAVILNDSDVKCKFPVICFCF